jgi:Cu+-exporting ATPase
VRHLALVACVGAGLAAYLTGRLRTVAGIDLAVILTLAGGFPVFWDAASSLARGRISAELAVAIAAVAALTIGQSLVAAEVVFILLVGEALEAWTVGRTRAGIGALLALRPRQARVRRDGAEATIASDMLRVGDTVIVRPGDRIPADARVVEGRSTVDESPMTGESMPADRGPGDEVFEGTINLHGAMEVSVVRAGPDTALARIIHLVEEAAASRAPSQRLADRYAAWFVPIVLLAAGVTYWITRDVTRSVAVLVVACPCALVLATPTAIAAGIGGLVRRGVLVKGGAVLEALAGIRCVVFDKTGTLTLARLRTIGVVAPGGRPEDVLRLAAAVERRSEHPVARAICAHAAAEGVAETGADEFAVRPGLGAEAVVEGARVRVGNARFLEEAGIAVPQGLANDAAAYGRAGCTSVFVARENDCLGLIAVRDAIRPEASAAVGALQALGIRRLPVLTGDGEAAAQAVGSALGLDEIRSGLMPEAKVEFVRRAARESGPVLMVGDGVNDAPALTAAAVGAAMADIGTDVAIESAGVVLIGGDLTKIAEAVAMGRRALRTVWQNILGFTLGFNVLAVAAASLGWIGPVAAAVVHQAGSLAVVLNSMRLLIHPGEWRHRLDHWREDVRVHRRRIAAVAAAAVAVAWLAEGVYAVRVGEVAVEQTFGRAADGIRAPGLHVRLPWPLATHRRVRTDEVRRVEVGFRAVAGAGIEPPAYEWNVQHRGGRYTRVDDEAAVWTGDENLTDLNLVVHVRIRDPRAALFVLGDRMPDGSDKWAVTIRAAAESALRAEMSVRPSDDVLAGSRASVEEAVLRRLRSALGRVDGGAFEVQAVRLSDVHPPLEVVPAFRDVAAAQEEREALIGEAQAYGFETAAISRGQARQRVVDAQGAGSGRVARAQGESDRFRDAAAAFRETPDVAAVRIRLGAVETLLAGRRKTIIDPADAGGRRMVWLGRDGVVGAGGMPPAPPPVATPAAEEEP